MKLILSKILIVMTCSQLLLPIQLMEAQSTVARPMLEYKELKGLLLKHERTVKNILSKKRFRMVSSKKRPESTLYTYKAAGGVSQIIVRVRKGDELVSELAWNEVSESFGNFTHDAVDDGFVPVGGNSQYHNRFLNMVLFVYYDLSDESRIPCVLRVVQ